ncbi:MAG: methyltransferase domain-containing protein [Planctomycetaceae bacterium]|nr:methyltransferase domain-containing protein [Planctomycetaceae bacterium]
MPQFSSQQKKQDEEYDFPYHYISSSENGVFRHTFNWGWGLNYQSTLDYLIERLSKEKFTSIVDIGCGDGRLTWEVHKSFPGCRVIGVDYSERAIGLAQNMRPIVDFQVQDIINPSDSLASCHFDCGLLIEVLEHIPDELEQPFLEAAANLLVDSNSGSDNRNGVLFLTVPHINVSMSKKHYRHYTIDSLTKIVSPFFVVDEVIPFQRRCFRKKLMLKFLSNSVFILNHSYCLRKMYEYYRQRLFIVEDEKHCERIFMRLIKK